MRALGVDYGDSRIGVAVSDPLMLIANRLCLLDGRQGRAGTARALAALAAEQDADIIVIGYPRNMDGSAGPRVKVTEKFAAALQEACAAQHPVEIVFWDERLTTKMADGAMRAMHVSQKNKGVGDEIAAMLILQDYLDSRRTGA